MIRVFRNIRFKLLFWLGLFLFTLFSIFAVLLVNSLKKSQERYIETTLSMALQDLKYELENRESYNIDALKNEFNIEILYIQLIKFKDEKSYIVKKSDDLANNELEYNHIKISNMLEDKIFFTKQRNKNISNERIKVATALLNSKVDEPIVLQFAMPYNLYTAFVKNIILILSIGLSLLVIAILFVSNFIISHSLKQTQIAIDEVKNSTIEIAPRLQKTHVAKEIDELIDTFNNLLQKIYISHKKITEFGQNASHELKTPLTIIRAEIELGLKKTRSIDEYKETLNRLLQEILNLQSIVEKVLFLSNNDENIIRDSFESVSVDALILEAINESKILSSEKNINILYNLEALSIKASRDFLKIAILNILQNAIKYSKTNSIVEINLNQNSFSIKDYGIGIAKEDISNIFDRFYRVNTSRTVDGNGLGLSIVKSILDIHNFKIAIDSKEGEYTIFSVFFK